MFRKELLKVLDDPLKSIGWVGVAKEMNLSVHQLQQLLKDERLSFDEQLDVVKASRSPELLRYILSRLDLAVITKTTHH